MSALPLVVLAGTSGTGKTTFLEKLIRELKRRNITVGTIKHHDHDFDIDKPGKDTWRHAQAGAVWIALSGDVREVTVAVEDDGIGFRGENRGAGYGLRGLAERAGRLGGHFAAGPSSHGGASIYLSLPREPQPVAVPAGGARR